MTISWKKNSEPELITKQLQESIIEVKDGKASYEAFKYDVYSTLLYNILDFPSIVPEIDSRRMISQCLHKKNSIDKLIPKNILTDLNKLCILYISRQIERFVLLTSISLNQSIKINRINLNNSLVIFESKLSKIYNTEERERLVESASKSIFGKIPNNYLFVRIHVSSRSIYHAADQAIDNIDYIRGIWNYVINRSFSYRRTLGGKPTPINKIILGPIHTIQNLAGTLMSKNEWWFEPSYIEEVKPYYPNNTDQTKLVSSLSSLRKLINKCNYPNEIKSSFIRYSRALDERDYYSAYLKLWGVLEFLAGTKNNQNHDTTIKRVASLYKERDFHLQVLRILKEFRNAQVHSGNQGNEIETYLIRLKNYVETMLHFHTTNKFHFESLEKASEFLELPYQDKEILYKLKLYKYAKEFRHII